MAYRSLNLALCPLLAIFFRSLQTIRCSALSLMNFWQCYFFYIYYLVFPVRSKYASRGRTVHILLGIPREMQASLLLMTRKLVTIPVKNPSKNFSSLELCGSPSYCKALFSWPLLILFRWWYLWKFHEASNSVLLKWWQHSYTNRTNNRHDWLLPIPGTNCMNKA